MIWTMTEELQGPAEVGKGTITKCGEKAHAFQRKYYLNRDLKEEDA